MAVIVRVCDAIMQRKAQPRDNRPPVYWWKREIASLRTNCLTARRKMQRAHYKAAKMTLKKPINASKKACFEALSEKDNENPWGDLYRVVMAKT